MEALSFQYSHEDGKPIWCHCIVTSHVASEECSYVWISDLTIVRNIASCTACRLSKNDLALEMIESFPAVQDEQVYVLMDGWYTSEKVINASNRKGFHVIAAVGCNDFDS